MLARGENVKDWHSFEFSGRTGELVPCLMRRCSAHGPWQRSYFCQGAGVPRCPPRRIRLLKLLSEKSYVWTSFRRHSDVYRLCPGLDPNLSLSSSSMPCTLPDVSRCLSSRPLVPSAIDPSSRPPSAAGGRAIYWWSGSLTGWRDNFARRAVDALSPPVRRTECAPRRADLTRGGHHALITRSGGRRCLRTCPIPTSL